MKDFRIIEQLKFTPELKGKVVPEFERLLVGGMGGSALPARALEFLDPKLHIRFHQDFGVPEHIKPGTYAVAISYSGNTGETLSFAHEILNKGVELAVVTSGGELMKLAEEKDLTRIQVPSGLMPRDSLFYMLKGLLAISGNKELMEALEKVSVDEEKLVAEGVRLGRVFEGFVPLIYTSAINKPLANLWKIFTNENAKVPAFTNTFPELTHNELASVIPVGMESGLKEQFKVLMLRTKEDSEGVSGQMNKFEHLAATNGVNIVSTALPQNRLERLVANWLMARSFAITLAQHYNLDPQQIKSIEDFKKL